MIDDKELDDILSGDDFHISDTERALFTLPDAIKDAMAKREKSDYVARHTICEDFEQFAPLFQQVRRELADGRRKVVKYSEKSLREGAFFYDKGVMLYIANFFNKGEKTRRGAANGRTRVIYEDGSEADLMLDSLRRGLYDDGYCITENSDRIDEVFKPKTTDETPDGWIYVLSSKSDLEEIREQKNLYKIGFSTTPVAERIRNARNEPTYLMADVQSEMELAVKDVNPQKLEDAIHRFFSSARFFLSIYGNDKKVYRPQEWYIVPLHIIRRAVDIILQGNAAAYYYNPEIQQIVEITYGTGATVKEGQVNRQQLHVLSESISAKEYTALVSQEKKYFDVTLKETKKKKYLLQQHNGNYIRKYDAIEFRCGAPGKRVHTIFEVKDVTYNPDTRVLHFELGEILERVRLKDELLANSNRVQQTLYDTSNLKILKLTIKQRYFDAILKGEKKEEYRELKSSQLAKYTDKDPETGELILRQYDAIQLLAGYSPDRDTAIVEVKSSEYIGDTNTVTYHFGKILEYDVKK